MFFRQLYDDGLAQASYLIGCQQTGDALVVDPRRDIETYQRLAHEHDLRIVAVAETHIHADYLSGGRELAAASGATLFVSGHGEATEGYLADQPDVSVKLARDGEKIEIGTLRARVRHTPGHTPEHLCFEIFESAHNQKPMLLLSGDFIFVADLGRPDLLEQALGKTGAAETGARATFASLRKAVHELPDFLAVWPAHGAGSACGKALGAIPCTTLGYERRFAWWSSFVQQDDERGFIQALLEGQPDAPSYFARMKHENRGFTPLLHSLPEPQQLNASDLRSLLNRGAVVVDTRPRERFCELHIKGSLSIPGRESFSTRAAWFLSPSTPIVLVASPERIDDLVRKLVRVGLDRVAGYVTDAHSVGLPTASLPVVTPQEANAHWSARDAVLIDVRQQSEFASGHIPYSQHLSAGSLAAHLDAVPRDRPIVVLCAGGDRSVTAASFLSAAGFERVTNMSGGFSEWHALGLPSEAAAKN
jgi:hydroxyacylglutathione hydrolase